METTYKYIIRPAEEGRSLLIFLDMPENKHFIKHIIQAFNSINLELNDTLDLFLKDELLVKAISDIGEFYLFRDNEDYYSISGPLAAINMLDTILENNPDFTKAV